MIVEIDKNSGLCFGVVNAIELAEKELERDSNLYCLGDIVHNNAEMQRLERKGLFTINHEKLKNIKNVKVLIRAHGEPPKTYKLAKENNIEIIDASCPVVLKLQNSVKKYHQEIKERKGQIVIYGKKGHAEVNGLVGQVDGDAIIVSDNEDLEKIDFSKAVVLFSQTTKSIGGFEKIENEIKKRMIATKGDEDIDFTVKNSICRAVSNRQNQLRHFVKNYELVIFVSGQKSSNGKMLYNICKTENKNTYFVSNKSELNKEWFKNIDSVGVCGATSTPLWLMEEFAEKIKNFT
jgi:4-hydroxy-3-methylbut-2-enyl diphosphate reductase